MRNVSEKRFLRGYDRILATALTLLISSLAAAQPGDDPRELWAQATLYRDEWGVPHVYGDNPRAMAFAFGYAQADDHLEPMLLAYRMANGRAAEVLGEPMAASDAFAIKLGHQRAARAALDVADPVTRNLCEGFAAGVNAWVVDNPAAGPEWAEGVQPSDVLALWHAVLVSMAPFDLPGQYRPPRAFETGNAWALSPKRTVEGASLLVINAHQYYEGPFQWYEAHLVCGEFNVAGATLYGLPVILQGHNEVLGWGLTPNDPDTADVFVEKLGGGERNPKNLSRGGMSPEQTMTLMYMSHAQPYYVRTESGLDERFVPAMTLSRGPVFEDGGGLFTWKIGGYGDLGGLYQLWEMGRSQTMTAFQDSMLMQQLPCFHVVYADRTGNLFYQYNAKGGVRQTVAGISEDTQARAEALDWKSPVSTEFEFYGWRNTLPPEAQPWFSNPAAGFIQACGNPPWLATDDAPLRAEDWPGWLITDADTYRARRARQWLRTGPRSLNDMYAMIYDVAAGGAADLVPRLLAAADQRPAWIEAAHPDLPAALDMLRGWNFLADPASSAMTFFHAWWTMVQARSLAGLPNDPARYAFLMSGTPESESLALEAAADAVRMMRNEMQTVAPPWGEVHRMVRGGREEPIAGAASGEPIFLSGDRTFREGRWYADYGYGFAMAVRFGAATEAFSVVPFGASDRPQSQHYADQWPLLREKRLKRARFGKEEVQRYAQSARGRHVILHPLGVEGGFMLHAPTVLEARLNTSTEAPAELPPGLAAFTLFVRPEWAPQAAPVSTEVELFVPEVLCETDHLTRLSIHVYVKDTGWFSLADQSVDPMQRVYSGTQDGAGVYAVLGPAACLIAPPSELIAPPPSSSAPPGPGIFAPGMPGAAPQALPKVPRPMPPAASDRAPDAGRAVEMPPVVPSTPPPPVGAAPERAQVAPAQPPPPAESTSARDEKKSRKKAPKSAPEAPSSNATRNFRPRTLSR
jgi:acyl-homoserine lactone acylase PvdQ